MLPRLLGTLLTVTAICVAAPSVPLRGKLVQQPGAAPAITVASRSIQLQADADTAKVLNDERLRGLDVEVMGHADGPDHFVVDGTETHPVFVWRNGKRLYVTYWCDVCYIRTFVPGNCWCCQKYTDLDLRESLDE